MKITHPEAWQRLVGGDLNEVLAYMYVQLSLLGTTQAVEHELITAEVTSFSEQFANSSWTAHGQYLSYNLKSQHSDTHM